MMKRSPLHILIITALVSGSLACSLFTPTQEPPTPDYIFTPSTIPLVFEPESLSNGQVGAVYEAEIRVRDMVTPISSMGLSNGSLPAGLELVFIDGEEGAVIRGTPTEAGTYTFTVFVACFGTMVSGQTGQREYVIVVE